MLQLFEGLVEIGVFFLVNFVFDLLLGRFLPLLLFRIFNRSEPIIVTIFNLLGDFVVSCEDRDE